MLSSRAGILYPSMSSSHVFTIFFHFLFVLFWIHTERNANITDKYTLQAFEKIRGAKIVDSEFVKNVMNSLHMGKDQYWLHTVQKERNVLLKIPDFVQNYQLSRVWAQKNWPSWMVYMCFSWLQLAPGSLDFFQAEQINNMTTIFTQNDNFVHAGQFWVSFYEFTELYITARSSFSVLNNMELSHLTRDLS